MRRSVTLSAPVSLQVSTASSLKPALVSASTTLRAVSWSSNNPMTEVDMANSSVMFLNQDGRAPTSTPPARAHKHIALQTVPTNRQGAVEKILSRKLTLDFCTSCDCNDPALI